MTPRHRRLLLVVTVVTLGLSAEPSAQLGGLLDRILTSRPALTSSLDTATGLFPFLPDDFEPAVFQPATWLTRTATGGFVLEPGAWEFQAEGYCLRAGTPRPSRGDGFALAPLTGPRAAIVQHILEAANRVPAVTQEQIQILLWAIVARTELRDLDPSLQRAATLLLSTREVAELSTDTLGRVSRQLLEDRLDRLPAIVQQVVAAEANIRDLAARRATYAEMAAAAVPEDADEGESLREIPRGRWIRQNGYFVRFLPEGYARVTVQLFVPSILDDPHDARTLRESMGARRQASVAGAGRVVLAAYRWPSVERATAAMQGRGASTYEPSRSTAVPGSSGGQRLGVSTRAAPDWNPGPPPPNRKRGPRKPPPPPKKDPPDPPDDCDPSPADLAGAQDLWKDWADSLEQQSHEYDEAERQSCPPSYSADEEAQFAYAREMIARYGGSAVPREREYAACVRQNVVNYRAAQQGMCDNIGEYRRRMQDHARRARDLANDWAKDPKGSFCKAQASVGDVARDQQADAFPSPPPIQTCTPP